MPMISPTRPGGRARLGDLHQLDAAAAGQMLDVDDIHRRIEVRLQQFDRCEPQQRVHQLRARAARWREG